MESYFQRVFALFHEHGKPQIAEGQMRYMRFKFEYFQLSYKEKTDAALLFSMVRRLSSYKEFFVQKGVGWALRQYAKTHPEAVETFVANNKNTLAPLTKREALKHLK